MSSAMMFVSTTKNGLIHDVVDHNVSLTPTTKRLHQQIEELTTQLKAGRTNQQRVTSHQNLLKMIKTMIEYDCSTVECIHKFEAYVREGMNNTIEFGGNIKVAPVKRGGGQRMWYWGQTEISINELARTIRLLRTITKRCPRAYWICW